ncbi:MAG: hypothetical protein ACXVQJ_10170 [Actinomycetota bacterium]
MADLGFASQRLRRGVAALVVAATFAIPPIPAVAHAPMVPAWQPIAKAPIPGRLGASVVWTGHRMIVWGGVSGTYGKEARADGAMYDPVTDRWHAIRSAPAGVIGGGGQAAAWTGKRMVLWVGNGVDGPVRGAVYDPRTDRWRTLPAGPLGRREGYVSAWTGTELIVIGGTIGDGLAKPIAAALDPRTGTWRRLPGLNHMDGLQPSGAVWSGDRLFVAGLAYDCSGGYPCASSPVFLSYDVATDHAEPIDLSGAPVSSITPIAWTGTEVFASAHDQASVVLYDPSTGAWRVGAAAPCPTDPRGYEQSAWLDGRYVTECGRDALQVYEVASDTWETLPAGSSPLNHREGSAIAWSGGELIAWSGTVYRPGNPTPNSGKSITLAPSPPPARRP